MQLHVLGSGSNGNGYILQSKESALIIEAGMPFSVARQALKFNVRKVAGVLVTHCHSDHAGRVKEYAKMGGLNIYSSHETLVQTGMTDFGFIHRAKPIEPGKNYEIGEFKVRSFDLVHDVRNYGYLIEHPEMGLICFLTDTHYSPFIFPGLNNIIVECNYSDNKLDEQVISGNVHPSMAERIRGSHMAESTMVEFLKANDMSAVNNICIIHLSAGNSDVSSITKSVTAVTGKTPFIAKAGFGIEFNKTPF